MNGRYPLSFRLFPFFFSSTIMYVDEDSFNMEEEVEDEYDNHESSQESDQQQTQSTQEASQQSNPKSVDTHLWGYLDPCNPGPLTRIDFWKIHPRYTVGRNIEINQVVFPGFKVSEWHKIRFL